MVSETPPAIFLISLKVCPAVLAIPTTTFLPKRSIKTIAIAPISIGLIFLKKSSIRIKSSYNPRQKKTIDKALSCALHGCCKPASPIPVFQTICLRVKTESSTPWFLWPVGGLPRGNCRQANHYRHTLPYIDENWLTVVTHMSELFYLLWSLASRGLAYPNFFIGKTIHINPFQYSRLVVSILKPMTPVLGLLGLPSVFQEGRVFCMYLLIPELRANALFTIIRFL